MRKKYQIGFSAMLLLFCATTRAQWRVVTPYGNALHAPGTTPTNGQVPSYNASTGQMTWSANAGGASAPAGTAVSDGSTFVAGTVPISKDTTGTNFTGTATLTITSTNASFKGTIFADNLVATNGITLGSGSTNLSVTGNVLANGGVFTNGVTVGTLNKVTITPPATGSTLTIADGKTATINNSLTLAGADGTTQTFQGSDTIVGRSTTDTLANKTLTAPILGTATGTQLTLSGSLFANDVNSTASGEGVMSETNAAATFVYREAPNATMTANVFHRNIPAAATGFYFGTLGSVTNEVDSIKASVSLSTDVSGTLQAAQMPVLTGVVTTPGGSLASSFGSFSSATLSTALTDEHGSGVVMLNVPLYQTKTGNYSIVSTESSGVFDNAGAGGIITLTLPAATAGMIYQFVVVTAQSLTVKANTGATIRNAASVSASAGTIAASTIGNVVTLRATSSTTWVVVSIVGTWTLT